MERHNKCNKMIFIEKTIPKLECKNQSLQTLCVLTKNINTCFGLKNTFVFACILDIDGGYTEWSKWTECTATCGGGTRRHSRTCTRPKPKNNGKTCVKLKLGPAIETENCNTKKCGKNITVLFRHSLRSKVWEVWGGSKIHQCVQWLGSEISYIDTNSWMSGHFRHLLHFVLSCLVTGLPGTTQVLVIRPVEEVHVRDKERAPTHPPLEMAKTAKEVVQTASLATHNHVSTTWIESLFQCYIQLNATAMECPGLSSPFLLFDSFRNKSSDQKSFHFICICFLFPIIVSSFTFTNLSICYLAVFVFFSRSNSGASSAKALQGNSWCWCYHRFLQQYKPTGLQYCSPIYSTTGWKTWNIWSRFTYGDPSLQLRSPYLAQVGK